MSGPSVDTLIFDGECGFCTAYVNWFRARNQQSVHIVAFQNIDPKEYGLTLEKVQREAWWVTPTRKFAGNRAIAHTLKACGMPWSGIGVMIDVIPVRWLAALVYQWIARHRNNLPGGFPACRTNGHQNPD